MTKVLDIYNKVRQQYGHMPELTPGSLIIKASSPFTIAEHDALLAKINSFNAETGWLTLQSKNVRIHAGDDVAQHTQRHGWILQGELINGGSSLHIRADGAGGWIAAEIETAGDDGAEGLLEKVKFVAMPEDENNQNKNFLTYQLYWKKDPEQGYRRELSRFTGFSATKGDE